MKDVFEWLWTGEDGQDLVEYALIVVLISLVAVAVLRVLGSTVFNTYSSASSNFTAAAS